MRDHLTSSRSLWSCDNYDNWACLIDRYIFCCPPPNQPPPSVIRAHGWMCLEGPSSTCTAWITWFGSWPLVHHQEGWRSGRLIRWWASDLSMTRQWSSQMFQRCYCCDSKNTAYMMTSFFKLIHILRQFIPTLLQESVTFLLHRHLSLQYPTACGPIYFNSSYKTSCKEGGGGEMAQRTCGNIIRP